MKPRDGEGVPVAPREDTVFKPPGRYGWKIRFNGGVLPFEWPDRASAQAALESEKRRRAVRAAMEG